VAGVPASNGGAVTDQGAGEPGLPPPFALFDLSAPEVEAFRLPRFDDVGDTELAERARSGDMAAFGEFYRRHAPSVAATARRVVSDPDVVADVVQETFGRALGRLGQLRDPARMGPWLASIARYVATDHLRARYRATTEDDQTLDTLSDGRTGPDVEAEVRLDLEDVQRGIALLSPSDAQAVTLCAHLGLSSDELAFALGVTPSAAKVRLHRARSRLRRILDEDPTTDPEVMGS
jgi:RNA polymerase sigma factor (sigma-70 family)